MKKILYPLVSIVLVLSGCSKSSNDGIPSYVSISNPTLQVQPGQGSALHGIETIWAESEGENFGAYELPAAFPVLVSGSKQIILNAGVRQSGDFFVREIYPCFNPFIETVNFTQKDTLFIQPVFSYKSQTEFLLIEDFENSNVFTGMTRTGVGNADNLEGVAGKLSLNQSTVTALGIMGNTVPLSRIGRTYIELHFKGTNNFWLGAQAFSGGNQVFDDVIIPMFKTDKWQKMYIEITFLLNFVEATDYKFYFRANIPPGEEETEVLIDNFKIVRI